jgi:hypothetical protein
MQAFIAVLHVHQPGVAAVWGAVALAHRDERGRFRQWLCASATAARNAARSSASIKSPRDISGKLIQIALGIERCHAAGTGRGAGLAVDVILHIAGSEDALDAGLRGIAFAARFQ